MASMVVLRPPRSARSGRSADKLKSVAAEIGANVPLIVADAADGSDAKRKQTRQPAVPHIFRTDLFPHPRPSCIFLQLPLHGICLSRMSRHKTTPRGGNRFFLTLQHGVHVNR